MVYVGETTGRLEEVFLRCSITSSSGAHAHAGQSPQVRYPMFVLIVMALASDRHQPVRHSRVRQGVPGLQRQAADRHAVADRFLQFHGGVLVAHAHRVDRLDRHLQALARNAFGTL
jgi:hypothetical protein